ncbi:MAG: MazG family protein [Ruminococcaceae bacterium]|nr:MazG family protein [Oscillospiraceae bacterium]
MNINKEKYTFDDLLWVVDKLRGENGCEWDRAQTHESLLKYLVEESYEYIEATQKKDVTAQAEELGDVLLQIVMSARIGAETGDFDISDVIDGICRKMIYRHPHVFSDTEVSGVEDILKNWDELKKKEKNIADDKEALLSVSTALPSLMRAQKVVKKIKKLEKNKKISGKSKETIDKSDKMVNNNTVFSIKIAEEEDFADALLKLVDMANDKDVSLELCLNNRINEIINRFN